MYIEIVIYKFYLRALHFTVFRIYCWSVISHYIRIVSPLLPRAPQLDATPAGSRVCSVTGKRCMYACMDAWMHGCMDLCVYVSYIFKVRLYNIYNVNAGLINP